MSRCVSPTTKHNIEDYATVEAHCDGVPVYAFGYTFVHGVSPLFDPTVSLQAGNPHPWRTIAPKKSWEIRANKLGSTPAREPKSARNDDQPLLSVHLIDGDPETIWCSRGQVQADVEPVWIRIDLPMECRISCVTLVPHRQGLGPTDMGGYRAGQALPRELVVKVSRDGWHWETVAEESNRADAPASEPLSYAFAPRPAKQIWIVGLGLLEVLNWGHCFSIAGVEVLDEAGENLALISRGAAVTVSSTHTGYGMDRFTQDMLWPIQYDLGLKWARVGYDMGVFIWAYVEREKGVLEVDPRADAAISEAVDNGINVIMCLDKGNWLYAPSPKHKDRTRELMETYYDRPPDPIVDAAYLEAYLRYIRYMVRHFKDRVRYFEIANEWGGSPQDYARQAKAAIAVVREEYPDARILPASTGGFARDFMRGYLREGLGPLLDVISWHPFYQADPEAPDYISYARDVREFKAECESYGFRGEFMATEWTWSAPYPPASGNVANPTFVVSEMDKACYAAQLSFKHVGLDMVTLWNETFQTQLTRWSIGLLRNTFSSDPITTPQPEPIYYVMRTLSTVLDDVTPLDWPARFSNEHATFESWGFRRGDDERMLAVWLPGRVKTAPAHVETNVELPGITGGRITGVDILNGREQDLAVEWGEGGAVVRGLRVRSFPLVLRWRGPR